MSAHLAMSVAILHSAPANEAPPPQASRRYVLGAELGRGGCGVVHEAWDTLLQRDVAIKRLAQGRSSDTALREARLTARVQHPAIVAVHEVFQDDDAAQVVMEIVRGRTLAEVLAQGPVSESEACAWIAEIADALAVAHDAGVHHGDIKPSNLMIQIDGRLRILDFGIAQATDALATGDVANGCAGTLLFMAPERLLGRAPDVASDIYALGMVLHELVGSLGVGRGDDALALVYRKLHGEFPSSLPNVSPALQRLILCMTHRDPSARPANMREARQRVLSRSGDERAPQPATSGHRVRLRTVLALLTVGLTACIVFVGGRATREPLPFVDVQRELAAAQRELHAYDDREALASATLRLEHVLQARPTQAGAAAALAIADYLNYVSDRRDVWLQRAQEHATRAVKAEPALALAHAALAWVDEARGRFVQSEQSYQQALALDPFEFHALNGYARLLMTERRFEQAQTVLEEALQHYPHEPAFLNAMGTVHYGQFDFSGAERWFNAAIDARPAAVISYANLSAALAGEGRIEEALSTLQRGLEVRPDGRLYANLGTLLFGQSRYAEAASAFQRALSVERGEQNDYRNWANLADALRWTADGQTGAQEAYRHALALLRPQLSGDPNATALSRAGLYAAHLSNCSDSRSWTMRALAAGQGSADVLYRSAVAAELCGDRTSALLRITQAFRAGFPPSDVAQDPELRGLRSDPEFTIPTQRSRP